MESPTLPWNAPPGSFGLPRQNMDVWIVHLLKLALFALESVEEDGYSPSFLFEFGVCCGVAPIVGFIWKCLSKHFFGTQQVTCLATTVHSQLRARGYVPRFSLQSSSRSRKTVVGLIRGDVFLDAVFTMLK